MFPQICKIGPVTVYSYGVALVAAFFISSRLAAEEARRRAIDPQRIYNLLFTVFLFGVAGARIFYVALNAGYYLKQPLEIIMLQRGGLAWFGGLIAAIGAGAFYIRRNKMPLLATLDLIAPFAALGQSIGRIGCFFNGCCWGSPDTPVPVQLLSSFLLLVIFVLLRLLQQRPHKPGAVFFSYLLLYALKRFGVEFLRIDSPRAFFGLTIFQLLSAGLLVIALFFLLALKRRKNTA